MCLDDACLNQVSGLALRRGQVVTSMTFVLVVAVAKGEHFCPILLVFSIALN